MAFISILSRYIQKAKLSGSLNMPILKEIGKFNFLGMCMKILLLGISLFFLVGCNSKKDKWDAYYWCQQEVKERLKAPSTADFASTRNSTIHKLSNNQWDVTSYVDSQNSFGANVRSNYECSIKFIDNGKRYIIKSLTIY